MLLGGSWLIGAGSHIQSMSPTSQIAVTAQALGKGSEVMWSVCDVPILHPLLEDTAHHLGASISCYVLWNIPGGAEVSHDSIQMLAVELALGGGHYGVLPREPVGDHQEVVAV